MTKQTRTTKTTKVQASVTVVDEAELLLAYQRKVNADILNASIEAVNTCVTSQERFIKAFELLCKQDNDFSIKALSYKSKQRNLLYKNQKVVYFTANFVNLKKTQVDKINASVASIKHYNHAFCYNVNVEAYASYEAIKQFVMSLIS